MFKVINPTVKIALFCTLLLACKQEYKLKFDNKIPEKIASLLINKPYHEGRNIMMDQKNWKLFVDIQKGKVDKLWYQTGDKKLVDVDSLFIPLRKDPDGNTTVDCWKDYNDCLVACPVVPWIAPDGNVGTQYAPNCVTECDVKYEICKNKGGFKSAIAVIR